MSGGPKLYKIYLGKKEAADMEEVDFTSVGLKERRDIQEWIAANPGILGQDLLVIAKEYSKFDLTRERLDLLAVALDGQLVIIEIKRDDTGDDVHWQAIKYASYFHNVNTNDIVDLFAQYQDIEEDEARQQLMEYTDSDEDLNRLNENQRIILASHRFAPPVTSAALWLNRQAKRDVVTCVQLTPYRDHESDQLYLLSNTIIPVPGAESYFIGLSSRTGDGSSVQRGPNPNRFDDVTQFCEKVGSNALKELPPVLRPTKTSRWAGGNLNWRYYHMWYAGEEPWGNWKMSYRIHLEPEESVGNQNSWNLSVSLGYNNTIAETIVNRLKNIDTIDELEVENNYLSVSFDGIELDDSSCNEVAKVLYRFVEVITPIVRDLTNKED